MCWRRCGSSANGSIVVFNAIRHGKMSLMVATIKIGRAGRIVLPKAIRDELRLNPGDCLRLECSEGCVILRPVRGNGRMYRKQGVWVMNSGEPLDVDVVNRTLRRVRAERDRRNLGKLQ